jgi:hypothetical protein
VTADDILARLLDALSADAGGARGTEHDAAA